jgi:preprotein translocase subunit SecY
MRVGQAATRQTPGRPQLLQAMIDAFRTPDLRARILFTLFILVIFRLLVHVPVPGVDRGQLGALFQGNQLAAFFNLFSGGGLRDLGIVALGVYPYITASIVIQILTPVFPRLRDIARDGDSGRQRINQFTHYLTVPIAFLQGYGQMVIFSRAGVFTHPIGFTGDGALLTVTTILSFVAGTMFLVWLGELITEKGIGNGISIIIFGGIVAGLPQLVLQGVLDRDNIGGLMIMGVAALGLIYVIVLFTEAQRRIPVQYGRSVFRGNRMYRQSGATHLPLRVNSAGMIPLIFASSIMILPGTLANYIANPSSDSFLARAGQFIAINMSPSAPFYWVVLFVLVIVFAFFYTLISFQQQQLAENLQKNGGFIPGIRPGQPTQQYLNRVMLRITWGGAIFLGSVAVAPFVLTQLTGLQGLGSGVSTLTMGTSLLIMVAVALDTMRQLEAQLLMRNYEGFLR